MGRILLIEPDEILGATIGYYLKRRKHHVIHVQDSQGALIEADTRRPDLVILELAMPQHNGIAFLQEFRSYSDWLGIPIVIYSHIPLEDTGMDENAWLRHGVESYAYKSAVGLDGLGQRVGNCLAKYEAA
jgi:two-component system KDP operon response regulator KdpE